MTVISACGYTGRVKLGIEYFESMVSDFGLEPRPEHYSCVVDLLCRAGELEKAWKMVNEMTPKEIESEEHYPSESRSSYTSGSKMPLARKKSILISTSPLPNSSSTTAVRRRDLVDKSGLAMLWKLKCKNPSDRKSGNGICNLTEA